MGALAAILFTQGPPDPDVARHMQAAAPHRGLPLRSVTHGACVLSVSLAADRPDGWLAADGDLAAAVVGTLDNLLELAATGPHQRADGAPDAAFVLITLFRAHREGAPHRLRGVFSGAVTDGKRLWVFRDHIGLSTLFYRQDRRAAYVATEAKQVLAGAGLAPAPDVPVLERIFYGRLDDDTPCALRGVLRLPKASIARFGESNGPLIRRYWEPETLLERARPTAADVREQFDRLMTQAVSRAINGPTAISLSGGIDSCAVAAFAAPVYRRLTGRPLPALSAVFPDLPSVDESPYIAMVVDALQISLRTYRPAAERRDRLQEWARLLDGPVPTVSISEIDENYRLARRYGFRVLLTGELGEFVYDQRGHLLSHLLWRGRLRWLSGHVRRRRAAGASWKKILMQFIPAVTPARVALAYVAARGLDKGARIPDWLDERKANETPYRDDLIAAPHDRWRRQQLLGFAGPGLTIEADDVLASLHGIHVRRPLADVDLWEFFLGLPAEVKFPDHRSKTLVRQLLRAKIPDVILDRTDKTVFNEFALAQIDYATLRRWLLKPAYRMPGVRYNVLAERLAREDFTLIDLVWANDLARIHAFLAVW